ncbi:hypothetical protein CpB0250 [Chlamydia pneumoniae TW-183]|uniref:Uncharacterized protein n=2 Tax=Chlamydia pneumoniae TaxID=83558 RepID=A0ABN3YPL7_CHLPN|nr:hypothetical protein CpB0250 [Chlamydia pneumoniae TW-183]
MFFYIYSILKRYIVVLGKILGLITIQFYQNLGGMSSERYSALHSRKSLSVLPHVVRKVLLSFPDFRGNGDVNLRSIRSD